MATTTIYPTAMTATTTYIEPTISEVRAEALTLASYTGLGLVKVTNGGGFTCIGDNWEITAYEATTGPAVVRGIGATAEAALEAFYEAILAH